MKPSQVKTTDIIGFPMDLGADRRGVDMGPSALRIAGISERLEVLGYTVSDQGDIPIPIKESRNISNPKLKYLDEIVKACEALARKVRDSLSQGHFPLCIGGDHSMSLGSVAGVSSYCRENSMTPGLIWIDAHADMNLEETTPSGNIHGMPVSASLGLGNRHLTHLMDFAPKIRPENCALIAIRSIDPLEKETIRKSDIPVYTMTDIDKRGAYPVISEALERLKKDTDIIHVSFDMDAVDPSVAVGVGTPVSGGLTYRETHLIMEMIAESGKMGALDIAEVNPILDNRNQSACFAAELSASVMGKRIL